MILLTCEQGSAEWHKARLGIPTSSHFDEIMQPIGRKPSSQDKGYMLKLLAEWAIGVPADAQATQFMERGTKLEEEARKWYAHAYDTDVQKVGLVLRDDRMVASSTDGLVGEHGVLEIKCPSAPQHLRNMLDGMGGYVGQTQGALWLTGRRWLDLVSYNPELPPVVTRIERDDDWAEAFEVIVGTFIEKLLFYRRTLLGMNVKPAERLTVPISAMAPDERPF